MFSVFHFVIKYFITIIWTYFMCRTFLPLSIHSTVLPMKPSYDFESQTLAEIIIWATTHPNAAKHFILERVFTEDSRFAVLQARGRQQIMASCGWSVYWCQLFRTLHSGATSTTAVYWKCVCVHCTISEGKKKERNRDCCQYLLTFRCNSMLDNYWDCDGGGI